MIARAQRRLGPGEPRGCAWATRRRARAGKTTGPVRCPSRRASSSTVFPPDALYRRHFARIGTQCSAQRTVACDRFSRYQRTVLRAGAPRPWHFLMYAFFFFRRIVGLPARRLTPPDDPAGAAPRLPPCRAAGNSSGACCERTCGGANDNVTAHPAGIEFPKSRLRKNADGRRRDARFARNSFSPAPSVTPHFYGQPI